MSLTVDGVWKSGVWAPTVWASGVWYEPGAAAVVTPEPVRGWHWRHKPGKKRLTKEELLEAIRQQRIEMGILPPDPVAPQAIPEPAQIAEEVAAAVNDQVVMADLSIDYQRIYKLAFMEAETAIAEYRQAKELRRRKVRRAVGLLMIH